MRDLAESSQDKPLPELSPITRRFWEATKKGKLLLQKCNRCGSVQFYPRLFCLRCGSSDLGWSQSSGKGFLYSYTVPRRVIDNSEFFASKIPFVIGIVELEEGPRMYTNIVQCEIKDVRIGMKLEVVFEDYTADIALPKFRPMTVRTE